jgi:hypothetical protein
MMKGSVKDDEVPELDWEPIWFWKPVNPDLKNPPNVVIIPPEEYDTLWRVPVEDMDIGKTYIPKGYTNLSFKVVNPNELGSSLPSRVAPTPQKALRQTRIGHFMQCKKLT